MPLGSRGADVGEDVGDLEEVGDADGARNAGGQHVEQVRPAGHAVARPRLGREAPRRVPHQVAAEGGRALVLQAERVRGAAFEGGGDAGGRVVWVQGGDAQGGRVVCAAAADVGEELGVGVDPPRRQGGPLVVVLAVKDGHLDEVAGQKGLSRVSLDDVAVDLHPPRGDLVGHVAFEDGRQRVGRDGAQAGDRVGSAAAVGGRGDGVVIHVPLVWCVVSERVDRICALHDGRPEEALVAPAV